MWARILEDRGLLGFLAESMRFMGAVMTTDDVGSMKLSFGGLIQGPLLRSHHAARFGLCCLLRTCAEYYRDHIIDIPGCESERRKNQKATEDAAI